MKTTSITYETHKKKKTKKKNELKGPKLYDKSEPVAVTLLESAAKAIELFIGLLGNALFKLDQIDISLNATDLPCPLAMYSRPVEPERAG